MALAADEALVVDIDLSILGQHRMRFADFEDGIGEEYAAVPKVALRWKRGRFLRGLLASPEIFATPTMRARHEAAARANLRALLAQHRYAWWGLWL
jgi:predicted metal-dependent HD superfamily phosphohydrolase